jgi:quinol monooxygenase YgiN
MRIFQHKLTLKKTAMSKYAYSGKITAHSGKRDELLAILTEAANSMAAVKGCNIYIVHKDPSEADAIRVYELWDSKQDHDASLQNEETRQLITKAMPLISGKPEGMEWEAIAGSVF